MGSVSIREDGKTEFAVTISKQKCRVARKATAVGKIPVAISHLSPPGQSKTGGLVAPNPFDPAFELIELPRHHLIHGRLANDSFALENSSVQVRYQPI